MASNKDQDKEDLDAFLTALESKMRGPYSSLELAKVVSTHSLRGSLSPQEYLFNVSRVLSRTDKLTQLRTLVGLLGLEPGQDTDKEVYKILTQAEEAPLSEEWVKVIAGLVRGILFVDDQEDGRGSRESCRGQVASKLLDKTCKDIVKQTRKLEKDTEPAAVNGNNNTPTPSLQTADMYPLFVSYRYSLLNPALLDRVIPEHKENPHFRFDEAADILSMDDKLEQTKAEEAQDHKLMSAKQAVIPGTQTSNSATEVAKPEFPGFKPTKKTVTANPVARPKSNFFMPTKRPGMPAGRGGRQVPMKGALHTRKAGAAQSLLNKNRQARMNPMGGAASVAAGSGAIGRAQKLANSKSKMKMIDVTEVQGLNKEHKQREDKIAQEESKEQKLLARKRKIMEAAAEKGLVAAPKIKKLEEEIAKAQPGGAPVAGSLAGAPVTAAPAAATATSTAGASSNSDQSNQEWHVILQERSNKLSDEDRARIEQFFTNRSNPTPEQQVYKMKLHEERTTDSATGQAMKETYYLELDYGNFTSKQSKKIKRY